jgi:hypothetical protein
MREYQRLPVETKSEFHQIPRMKVPIKRAKLPKGRWTRPKTKAVMMTMAVIDKEEP